MSADSTRKQPKQSFNSLYTVLPQPVSDPSIIESVAGFIHEVVPQAYSSVLPGENRESILWARFESSDYNDPENYPQVTECESESTPPLLLILGYGTGVQVWSIGGSGDAVEVLSWSQGSVRTLRILKKPLDDPDPFINKRPLIAIVDSAGPGPQYCTVNFVSLKTAEVPPLEDAVKNVNLVMIKTIKFKTPICDIQCNSKSIVITFVEKIAIFDIATFEDRLTITTCFHSPGICPNPVALGHRWLAYAEKRLTTWQRSSGGSEGDGAQSYTATAIHAVKTLGKGLRDLSGSLTGNVPPQINNNTAQPGIVTIVDIETKPSKEDETDNVIAHFVAHVSAIVAMTFDSSGLLLVTADKHGHHFHVFKVHPHPVASQLAAVHHLYILHRGETTARVQDITVSWDSRWIAVSSVRGTTHVFPVTPYGGPVTVRTHTTPNVVNRLSRFERSAGLSDGRGSPLLEIPSQPLNPRLPPYPHPTVLSPLAQLRRTPAGEESPLAAIFASPRGWIPGRQRGKKPVVESLFIISSGGTLIQYDLDPKCLAGVPKDKVSYDTAIELGVEAKAEWSLLKPPYSSNMQPPLMPNNPLLNCNKLPYRVEPSQNDDRWLSQVEIVTHTGPHRRLWMGPQFSFKSVDPLPSSSGEDVHNENVKPVRSNPVNMPHRPYLLIEGGSGGSIESPHLTGYGSGNEDIGHGESRLREDLADAMMETATHHTGIVGGVRLKAALLERQVNPLGTVITLPTNDGLQLQHPVVVAPLECQTSLPSTSGATLKVDLEDLLVNKQCNTSSDMGVQFHCDTTKQLSTLSPGTAQLSSSTRKEKTSLGSRKLDEHVRKIFVEFDQSIVEEQLSAKQNFPQEKSQKSDTKVKNKSKKKSVQYLSKIVPVGNCEANSLTTAQNKGDDNLPVKTDCLINSTAIFETTLKTENILIQSSKEDKKMDITETDYPVQETIEGPSCLDGSIASGEIVSENILTTTNESTKEKSDDLFGDSESSSEPITAVSVSIDFGEADAKSNILELNAPKASAELIATSLMGNEPEINILKQDKLVDESPDIEDSLRTEAVHELESPSAILETADCLLSEETAIGKESSTYVDEDMNKIEGIFSHGTTKKVKNNGIKKKITKHLNRSIADHGKEPQPEVDYEKLKEDDINKSEISADSFDDKKLDYNSESSLKPEVENLRYVNVRELLEKHKRNRLGKNSVEENQLRDPKSKSNMLHKPSTELTQQCTLISSAKLDDVHSETELFDIKKPRRERARKIKSCDFIEGEIIQKSPSPSKSDPKGDTDSSDEMNSRSPEGKTGISKQIKRKRTGKKLEDQITDVPVEPEYISALKQKSKSEGTLDIEKSDYETCSEKKSDSSVESFPDLKKKVSDSNGNFQEMKSWSSIVKNSKDSVKPSTAEDRDSVYESCNDEEFPSVDQSAQDSAAFESSKEDFEMPKQEQMKTESGSSNTEEKTDSGEKDIVPGFQNPKKVRKQKKKRR